MKIRTSSLALLLLGTAHGAWAASTQSATVEFFNQNLQHYFVTADAAEALAIDSGAAGPGWVRTGRSFNIFADTGAAPAGAVPVCRFYSKGSNGHFYTADAAECAQLKSLQVTQQAAAAAAGQPFTGWTFESVAFAAAMPSGGSCAAGSEPVYRFMSAGAQSGSGVNHRFVTGSDMAGVMQDRGWTAEGIALCSPVNSTGTSAPAAPVTNSFPELVATWTGNGRYGYQTLPGGTPTRGAGPLSLAIADDGTITGTAFGCTATGAITAGDGFHSLYTGTLATAACTDTNLIGSFTLHLEREGTTTRLRPVRW